MLNFFRYFTDHVFFGYQFKNDKSINNEAVEISTKNS